MPTKKINDIKVATDFSKFTEEELIDAFVFPSLNPAPPEETQLEDTFWQERRIQFNNRTTQQKIRSKLLQLKFQLEDYVESNRYDKALNFGYFLHEYVTRQEKPDKDFAFEVDIKPVVLSQYINNHRNPTDQFIIRLELHSNEMLPALSWFKLLQKDKEHALVTDKNLRRQESKHVKSRIEITY